MGDFLKIDASALTGVVRALVRAKAQVPAGAAGAVNRAASRARPVVVGALTAQTGLPKRTVVKAVKLKPATAGRPVAMLVARGGDISLKYFHPTEGGGGVTATVKGRRVSVPGAFMTAGPKGHRVAIRKLGGHVFVNADGKRWRGRLRKVRSGVLIPAEMTSGETLAAFERIAAQELPAEGVRALAALLASK